MTASEIRFYFLEFKMLKKVGFNDYDIEEKVNDILSFYDDLCDILYNGVISNKEITISITKDGKVVEHIDYLPIYKNKQIQLSEENDIIYNIQDFLKEYEKALK